MAVVKTWSSWARICASVAFEWVEDDGVLSSHENSRCPVIDVTSRFLFWVWSAGSQYVFRMFWERWLRSSPLDPGFDFLRMNVLADRISGWVCNLVSLLPLGVPGLVDYRHYLMAMLLLPFPASGIFLVRTFSQVLGPQDPVLLLRSSIVPLLHTSHSAPGLLLCSVWCGQANLPFLDWSSETYVPSSLCLWTLYLRRVFTDCPL